MAEIQGLNNWLKWVEGIPEEVQEEVREIVQETALKIEADAKRLTPVDTGYLRNSINTQFDIQSKGFVATIGTPTSYAPFVEFGTSKQHPQPFLTPSYVKHRPKFVEKIQEIANRVGD